MRLNPELDIQAAAHSFSETGRVVVRDILPLDLARSLHARFEASRGWELCINGASGPEAVDPDEFARATPEQQHMFRMSLRKQAQQGFAFLYLRQDIVPGEVAEFSDLRDFIQSETLLQLMQAVSGDQELVRLDAQLTLYQEGCFLKSHDDTYSGKDRRIAYVLNLSKDWNPDWGGLLHFTDEAGNVIDTIVPAFNSLAVFRVPASHFVSMVTNYALGNRFTITGWGFGSSV